MSGLKIMAMGGYVPRVAPHLLNDNEAQKALNTKLYAGDLRAWRKPGSFAQHEAFGQAYDALTDLIDTFVETLMGKYGRIKGNDGFTIELQEYDSISCLPFLTSCS